MPRAEGEFPKNLRRAVTFHCRECNDVPKSWHEENDCKVWRCWLYPFRPGTGGEERVVKKKRKASAVNISALANYRLSNRRVSDPKGA